MYVPKESTTSDPQDDSKVVTYGDNARVKARLYSDTIVVGGLTGTEQTVGAVPVEELGSAMKASKANGLIGLGLQRKNDNDPPAPNLVESLQSEDKLKYASFSLIGPRVKPEDAKRIDQEHVMQPRGWFVIGSVDNKFYTGDIAWCPTLPNVDRWVVELDAVIFNDEVKFTKQKALIDTGTAFMLVSQNKLKAVQSAISGSSMVGKDGILLGYPSDKLTSVSFKLGGRSFRLQTADFTLGQKEKVGNQDLLVSSICSLKGRWPFDEDLWILGGIFLDNIVTIFDFEKKALGFADVSDTDLGANTYATAQ